MDMPAKYEDLTDVLAEVSRSVPDNRFIWCMAADGFETIVSCRKGLLLGGALSPWFLRNTGTFWYDVPDTMWMSKPHVALIERAIAPLLEWIPLMEDIAKTGDSMLLVTQEISGELVRTLSVNSLRGALKCSAVRLADDLHGYRLPGVDALGKPAKAPPREANGLPKADEAWIRRTATVLFPDSDEEWGVSLSDVAIISVGGDSYDEQQDRLRFLVRAIQAPRTKSA
jgi:hypothetical protein